MKIYLAGKVPKGDKEAKSFDDWRLKYQEALKKIFYADFIMPYNREADESDFLLVVGLDCSHIKESDLIVVNAEERLGVGTAQELVIAKYFKKPIITVLPKDTYHRRSNVVFHGKEIKDWIHPFIYVFSDIVVERIDEIKELKDKISTIKIKDISIIDEAIQYVKNNQKPSL